MFSLSTLYLIGHVPRECNNGKGMLSSVEQAFVGREEIRAPLKTPAWEATSLAEAVRIVSRSIRLHVHLNILQTY